MSLKTKSREFLSKVFPQLDPNYYIEKTKGQSPEVIFSTIYEKSVWGGRLTREYYSGSGSRDVDVVNRYVKAVAQFLDENGRPSVLDLGCGDFHVGSRLVGHSQSYVACDIVPDLIEHLRKKHKRAGLKFQVVNAIDDDLPTADVVMVRQVLQHLSNEQIAKILPKLRNFKFAIVSEGWPLGDFKPNIDMEAGAHIRSRFRSGVVLSAEPFKFSSPKETLLSEILSSEGALRTILYEF